MKVNCAQMAGNFQQSMDAAKQLETDIPAFYLSFPGAVGNYAQYLHQSLLLTQVRFGKWEEILNQKVNDTLTFVPVLQHFGRGIAFAKTSRINEAMQELEKMKISMGKPALKEPLAPFNSAYDVSVVAENILAGTIAEQQETYKDAISFFQKAVQAEDHLIYNEPRDWLIPSRQYLGNVLLKAGRYNDALGIFSSDLSINPNNGWALTGVEKVYKKLNNTAALTQVERRLKNAWLIKDVKIESPVF
jgi:tetratricopeptide (TPR) repeat protein